MKLVHLVGFVIKKINHVFVVVVVVVVQPVSLQSILCDLVYICDSECRKYILSQLTGLLYSGNK